MTLKGLFLSLLLLLAVTHSQNLYAESLTCTNKDGKTAFQCLVCNCFHESRGESKKGRIAVGKVVMTRFQMSAYPDSVCGVVYQGQSRKYSQFSWTKSNARKRNIASKDGYKNCYNEMKDVAEFTGHYASHYHTVSSAPKWRRNCSGRNSVGNHYFYTDCGNQSRAPEATKTNQ